MDSVHTLSGASKTAAVVAAFFIHFVTHGIVYSFGVLFIALDGLFQGSKAEISWIGSIATAMIFLGGPVTGYLTAKFGCRYVAVAGSLVSFLGYGASLFVSNLYVLYATMGFVAGSGFGLLYLPAVVAVTQAFNKYRTVATALSLCGAGIGAFVFSPLQKILLDEYSWQGTLLINAGILLNCAPFALLLRDNQSSKSAARNKSGTSVSNSKEIVKEVEVNLLNDSEEYMPGNKCSKHNDALKVGRQENNGEFRYTRIEKNDVKLSNEGGGLLSEHNSNAHICSQKVKFCQRELDKDEEIVIETEKAHSTKKASFVDNLNILKEPLFVLFTSSQFLFFFGLYLPFMYIPDRAKHIGIDDQSAVWVVSTIGISSITSRIVLGYAVDRLFIDRSKFLSCTLLIGGISTALGPVFTSLWILFLYAAVYGICIGVSISFISVVLADLLGIERLNEAFGMNNLFSGIAVLLGPPFAGFLFDMTGDYNATFVVAGVSQALAGLLMFFTPLLRKTKSPRF